MSQSSLSAVFVSRRTNAVLGWLLSAFLLAAAAVALLDGEFVWAGLTLTVAVLAILPGVAYGGLTTMLPWEVLALATLPVVGRTLLVGETVAGVTLTGRVTAYLAVAAVALIVAVELDVFTPVRMNVPFAVLFVVVTTTAAAGVWAVTRWLSDVYLRTSFLLDGRPEKVVETALMWDFVAATVGGVLAGVVFEFYVRRRVDARARLPASALPTDPADRTDPAVPAGRDDSNEPEVDR